MLPIDNHFLEFKTIYKNVIDCKVIKIKPYGRLANKERRKQNLIKRTKPEIGKLQKKSMVNRISS